MAASPDIVSWDSCAWISLIQKEKIRGPDGKVIEDREKLCKAVLRQAEKGTLRIASSAMCLPEVIKGATDDYFEHEFILMVQVDTNVGAMARALMQRGHPKLRPIDAVHIATALAANAQALHTFDKRILALDGVLDMPMGGKLRICRPSLPGKEPPLLAEMTARAKAAE
jgi:predicted nucleic acid-binding protein